MKNRPLFLALCILLLAGGLTSIPQELSDKQVQKLAKKWITVKGWEGSYTSTYTSEQTVDMGNGLKITTSIRVHHSASAIMDKYYDPPARGIAEFVGVGSATWTETKDTVMVYSIKGGKITIRETIKSESSGKIGGGKELENEYGADIQIDCHSGTYSFGFADPDAEGITTVKRSISGMPTNFSILKQAPEPYATLFGRIGKEMEAYVKYSGDIKNAGPLLTGIGSMAAMQLMPDRNRPTEFVLPKSGLILAGSYSSPNLTETWRITPKGRSQFMELEKCPKTWVPSPDPEFPHHNAVPIKITGEGWLGEPAKLRITLYEVSKEDGLAINYLGDERPRDAFDLDFDNPDNKSILGEQRETEDGYEIETTKEVMNLEFKVACYDGAAWGKLKVEAKLKDSDEWYPVFTKENKEYITIPLDERGDWENKIADYWEEKNHLPEGEPVFTDDEISMGDGLTIHEEYRGFYAKGADDPYHDRGDPQRLDVFIMCEDELLSGSAPDLEKAYPNARIRILDLLCAPPLRVINAYSSKEYKAGDQHYIRMFRGRINTAGVLGVTNGNGMEHWTPGDVDNIIIDVAKIREFGSPVNQTVVHEIFHAIGVNHHGPENKKYKVPTKDNPTPAEAAVVATYRGPNSGRVECVMCYATAHFFENASGQLAKDEEGEPIDFETTKDLHRFDFICIDRTGSGPNKDGGQVGDATAGYCYAQVKVRDF